MKSKLFILACILLLSGCTLANTNNTYNPDKDLLIGVMIAQEENAYTDGIYEADCDLTSVARHCYFDNIYEQPIYALVGQYVKAYDGNIMIDSSGEQGKDDVFHMIHNKSHLKELVFEYETYYTKPITIVVSKIYQNEDGIQYVIVNREKDTIILEDTEWDVGFIHDKTTKNFLSQESIYTKIQLTFSKKDTPIETKIHFMSKDNQVLDSYSYHPNEVPHSLNLTNDVEYIIFETIVENENHKQISNRSIYSKQNQKIQFHENQYPLEDGFIGLSSTIIEWK